MARKPKHNYTDPQLLLRIEGWARDGWEDKQIAEQLGLNEQYFCEIKLKFPELAESLNRGRQPLDIIVENSIYKRAIGMKIKTVTKRWMKLADGSETDIEVISETTQEIPPDFNSGQFWLKFRKPEIWNKQPEKIELTGKDGKDLIPEIDYTKLSTEDLKKLHELMEKANAGS